MAIALRLITLAFGPLHGVHDRAHSPSLGTDVRIQLPPAKSRSNDGHRCDLVANRDRDNNGDPASDAEPPRSEPRAGRSGIGAPAHRSTSREGLDFDESTTVDRTQKPAARQFYSKLWYVLNVSVLNFPGDQSVLGCPSVAGATVRATTEDEQRLRQFCFPLLNPVDVARLCRMRTWEHIEAGTCLNTTGCWRASR